MWVLDVIHAATSAVETSFYLIAGEWSIGRKKCHFCFPLDASISRSHAVIRVGALTPEQLRDPLSRPALVLVDQNSRFGSFVNQEQCFGERGLRHGDQITFGAKRTVLRVRYQVFVLVASRIQRANRVRVNDTCQRIGMHLIAAESKNATHCIMDPGRIVATVKVLWALVFNQPVVTTEWIYAILNRKSLSEALPRCELFLPTDENLPSVTSNYLPNAMRKTLFHHHVIVFLAAQSMEVLITAMDGITIAAYKDPEHDDLLLRQIEQSVQSRTVLIVEPSQGSGFSSGAASSDARDTGGAPSNASVERRVDLFRSIGATFTTIQELAASVIFVKPPISASECSFSSSLAGHNSISAQIMSFPEHLSLRPPQNEEAEDSDEDGHKDQRIHQQSRVDEAPETASRIDYESHTPLPQPHQSRRAKQTDQDSVVDESIVIKDEPAERTSRSEKAPVAIKTESFETSRVTERPRGQADVTRGGPTDTPLASILPVEGLPERRLIQQENPELNATEFSQSEGWVSARDLVSRPLKNESMSDAGIDATNSDRVKPVVVSCKLVVKRPPSHTDRGSSESDSVPNFKRFKKGNGYSSRSMASLFPRQTVISVTIDNADREAITHNLEALEEQERIAEELFAMVEKRTARKRL